MIFPSPGGVYTTSSRIVPVERQPELGVQRFIDEPADALIPVERTAREHVVELQPLHGLTLAEIEAGVDGLRFARRDELVEDPVTVAAGMTTRVFARSPPRVNGQRKYGWMPNP